jgi:hypothetical protein
VVDDRAELPAVPAAPQRSSLYSVGVKRFSRLKDGELLSGLHAVSSQEVPPHIGHTGSVA